MSLTSEGSSLPDWKGQTPWVLGRAVGNGFFSELFSTVGFSPIWRRDNRLGFNQIPEEDFGEIRILDLWKRRKRLGELMATSQRSSHSEDQSPQPSSSGYYLEVEVDDEIPGPSAPVVEGNCPLQVWKREWSSDSERDLEEDLPGIFDLIPWGDPSRSPQYYGEKRDWEWSSDSQEELPGLADSILRLEPSSPLQLSAQKDRDWVTDSEEEQPGLADSALGAEPRLPPQSQAQKRKRECTSESKKELEQEAPDVDSEPQHPSWTVDTRCGLKMTLKRKRVSSVLPEHHEVFTRLLEDTVVKRFLAWDKKLRVSDKYLLSMVIAYFSRAGLFSWQYRRIHFFLALYIASDMEEDNQAPKEDMFSFLYGKSYAQRPLFHKLRYQFLRSMRWNTRVSQEECEEIQAYNPGLWVWNRDRTLLPTSPETMEA